MNWKELYALVNENIKNAVSGLYKPAGDVTFAELPELSQSVLGYTYTVTDAFTTDNRFTDYDTETQTGHSFPADTEVAVIVTGTTENPVYMFNVMGGIMDGYATKGDLDNYVEKEAGKGLSTNDYTDADKALVQDSPITVTATSSDLTLSTAAGNVNALTVYGKSEVVDGEIVSAGEGWSVVDLGDLTWYYDTETLLFSSEDLRLLILPVANDQIATILLSSNKYTTQSRISLSNDGICVNALGYVAIMDDDYTNAAAFKTAVTGVKLIYPLADPTQGNCIAVKTDDGSGINGTMAVFTTGTPLYGVSETVRDTMEWDGSAGEVTKNCGEVDLGTLFWIKSGQGDFYYSTELMNIINPPANNDTKANMICGKYTTQARNELYNKTIVCTETGVMAIMDTDYTDATALKNSLNGVMLVYELATPTTEPLTSAENASIAGLKTFQPQTHVQNNAGTDMTVEAYAGTDNGKAVADLKSELKITQSDTLTLTVAGWSSNQQTVSYAHDTAKRNVIDVDPASIEEWASCGVLATAETATSITFTCKTVPENALTFRVTSMGVN